MKAPAKNRHGLVIPPDPAKITQARELYYGKKVMPDRHHLYFPRVVFRGIGSLAFEFREHRFNSIWLPRFQHEKLHRRYDAMVMRHPDYLVPSDDVMATFLDEAHLLDELDVCVKAIDMIDEALYEGKVTNETAVLENRDYRLGVVRDVVDMMPRFEIVTPLMTRAAMQDVERVFASAA